MTDDDETLTLRHDVLCILVECNRDRGLKALRTDAPTEAISELAEQVARRLVPRIGGRYMPKGKFRMGWEQRAARDAAVWHAFNGRNRDEVLKQFSISKRLFYSILARKPRASAMSAKERVC